MKKLILVVLTLSLFAFSGSAFATQDVINLVSGVTNAEMQVGTAGAQNAIKFGLSPKVVARYYNPGTDQPTAQWYSLGTVHPGGNLMWATAQDLNNIYSKAYVTGTTINAALINIATVPSSTSVWTGNGWEL